jgi:hypothetical protein
MTSKTPEHYESIIAALRRLRAGVLKNEALVDLIEAEQGLMAVTLRIALIRSIPDSVGTEYRTIEGYNGYPGMTAQTTATWISRATKKQRALLTAARGRVR